MKSVQIHKHAAIAMNRHEESLALHRVLLDLYSVMLVSDRPMVVFSWLRATLKLYIRLSFLRPRSLCHSTVAVSYTHLDVYKRQVILNTEAARYALVL